MRKITGAIPVIIALTALLITEACGNNEGGKDMNDKVNELFNEAVNARGDIYRSLRQQLIDLDSELFKKLDKKSNDSDWHINLQVDIIMMWRINNDQTEQVRRLAEGQDESLNPQKYMTGRAPAGSAIAKIRDIGPSIAPILIEMIYKEADKTSDYAFTVTSKILTEWKDPRAVDVFSEILMDSETKTAFRLLSLTPLAAFKPDGFYDNLEKTYVDISNSVDLRSSALTVIGVTDDGRAMNYLKRILLDSEIEIRFRAAAASGLGNTKKGEVLEILENSYEKTTDLDFREAIAFAITDIESKDALSTLRRLFKVETDEGMQELIENGIQSLIYLEEEKGKRK